MFNKTWLLDTGERLVRTFAQAFLGTLAAGAVSDHLSVSALQAAGAAGIAAVIALAFAIVSAPSGTGAGVLVDAEPKT